MFIIQAPIEPLEERYSKQWKQWFKEEWKYNSRIFEGLTLTDEVKTGAFLDVYSTCYYKTSQMNSIINFIYNHEWFGQGEDNWVFFQDLWNPAVFQLAYIRSCAGLKFKIAGCFHAGTWDPTDFISKMGVGNWAKGLEDSLYDVSDLIFVATEFHKNLIKKDMYLNEIGKQKIKVTGFPIYADNIPKFNVERDPKLIIFPHRLTSDKRPDLVPLLKSKLGNGWNIVCTQENKRSKAEYYKLLQEASIAISFAEHENWGIAMQEALFCGCVPFMPDRLSYKEMYPSSLRYKDMDDLVKKILDTERDAINRDCEKINLKLKQNGRSAISNMKKEMKEYVS